MKQSNQLPLEQVGNPSISDKPDPSQYGYVSDSVYGQEETGWLIEGGEYAYHEALGLWMHRHPAVTGTGCGYCDDGRTCSCEPEEWSETD